MLYALILLQLADIASTHYALKSGAGTEGNPILRRLFDKFGHEKVLLAIKGAFIAWLLWAAPLLEAAGYGAVLWAIAALYVWVVWNNARVIYNATKGRADV
jgi:hypothetical protein